MAIKIQTRAQGTAGSGDTHVKRWESVGLKVHFHLLKKSKVVHFDSRLTSELPRQKTELHGHKHRANEVFPAGDGCVPRTGKSDAKDAKRLPVPSMASWSC